MIGGRARCARPCPCLAGWGGWRGARMLQLLVGGGAGCAGPCPCLAGGGGGRGAGMLQLLLGGLGNRFARLVRWSGRTVGRRWGRWLGVRLLWGVGFG